MRTAQLLICMALALSLGGCAFGLGKSLHEFSMMESAGESTGAKKRPIEVESEQTVIILTSNTDFVDSAYQDLLSKCPRGRISNVTTWYSTDLGFLAYKNKIKLRGTCLE